MMNIDPFFITFFMYLLSTAIIGVFAYRATDSLSDYIIGGRKLGSVVTALSAGASDMSGWLLMALPGAVFLSGLSEVWIVIGLIIGAWLNWRIVAGRLRIFTEINNNTLTLPEYFLHRFNDHERLLKIFASLVILIFFVVYCASGIVASARLFNSTFDMEYSTAVWIGAVATILYVFAGGFLAVSWTDTIQAVLMIFALLITPIAVILSMGDINSTIDSVRLADPAYLDIFNNLSVIGIISLLAWGLGYFGQPHILVRFMAADSLKTIPKARKIAMTWMILCLIGAVSVGFFGLAYFITNPALATNVTRNHEQIFTELTKLLLNPWLAGIVLSGVFAAVMSTLSCQLLVASSTLTEDIYKGFFRKNASEKELIYVGRTMVILISLIAIYIARNSDSGILALVSYAWAGFGAAFGPVVILSLLWKRMTRNGALAGMVVGAVTVILYKNLAALLVYFNLISALNPADAIRMYPLLALYEIIPGFSLPRYQLSLSAYWVSRLRPIFNRVLIRQHNVITTIISLRYWLQNACNNVITANIKGKLISDKVLFAKSR